MLVHMPHHQTQNTHGWKRENTEFLPLFGVLQMLFSANDSGSPVGRCAAVL